MLSTVQLAKFEPEQVIDPPAQLRKWNPFGFPNELLLRVVSLLPTTSIPNLMVNRSLRSICEQGLYRSISLPRHPHRSIHLLETFLVRPDLALLVRHLEINFSWRYLLTNQVPPALHPDVLEALRLAKNIQSLCVAGVADWIWEPEMAKFRQTIFTMKLVRLRVPVIRDPHTKYTYLWAGDSDDEEDWDGDLGDEIQKLLQAQPLLEEFKLTDTSLTTKTSTSLRDKLKHSDVPSLKSLQASPHVAVAFLPIADRLESLSLMSTNWDDPLLSDMEIKSEAIKLFVRHFTIRVWYSNEWLWSNLAKVFALFPKTEELSVTIDSFTNVEHQGHFFEKVGNNLYNLPSLRHIEVQFVTRYPETPKILEVGKDLLVEYKTACPTLESVVDPAKRLWAFRHKHQCPEEFEPRLVGSLLRESLEPVKDLPAPEGTTWSAGIWYAAAENSPLT